MFRDKDPVIDQLRTLAKDEYGGVDGEAMRLIHEAGGPSVGAMNGWFFGDTMRPQNPTVEAAGRAMGYHRTWTKLKR